MERVSDREKELRIQAAELRSDLPKLDLHGMQVKQALRAVDTFLDAQLLADADAVRIVYGIGKGTLRQHVLEHAKQHPAVALVKEEGKQVSCLVLLAEE